MLDEVVTTSAPESHPSLDTLIAINGVSTLVDHWFEGDIHADCTSEIDHLVLVGRHALVKGHLLVKVAILSILEVLIYLHHVSLFTYLSYAHLS